MPETPDVPPLSCDSHMHVFGPPDRYPGAPSRLYSPTDMPFDRYVPVAAKLGLERVVFVQPSAYGTDNRCMLDTMAALEGRARGVVVVEPDISDSELARMHDVGVRAVRLNLMTPRVDDPVAAQRLLQPIARRIGRRGWHIQVYADPSIIAPIATVIRSLDVPVVLDHMAGARAKHGVDDAAFLQLVELLADGGCWVKLSGADIVTGRDRDFAAEAAPFVRTLARANPSRIVWGTDWPHLVHFHGAQGDAAPQAGYRPVDETALLALLRDCVDAPTYRRVLVDNPQSLYAF